MLKASTVTQLLLPIIIGRYKELTIFHFKSCKYMIFRRLKNEQSHAYSNFLK